MKTELWSTATGGIAANMAFVNNPNAATNPAVTDDASKGYSKGSTWVNTSSQIVWTCMDPTAGAAVWIATGSASETNGQITAPAGSGTSAGSAAFLKGGTGGATNGAGGAASLVGGAGQGTGNGAAANVTGGASGAGATGDGAAVNVTGGAALSTLGNGGSVVLAGGAKTSTGVAGGVRIESVELRTQGAPAAKTVSVTLTAAEVLSGIITVNQGGAGASALQLPLATDFEAALPVDAVNNDAFDFSLINISTVAAESASITTNTGWTLVGDMDVSANSAATTKSAARFRARRTASGAYTLYRLS